MSKADKPDGHGPAEALKRSEWEELVELQQGHSEATATAHSSRVQFLPGLISVEQSLDGVYRYRLGHQGVETGLLSRSSIFELAIAGNCDHTC